MENHPAPSALPFPVKAYFDSDADQDLVAVFRSVNPPGNNGYACSFESLKNTSEAHTRKSADNLLEAFSQLRKGAKGS
ncbi:MAG: hypothetical protein WC091_25685 [Sulfuricellaceae bacterium]